MIPLAIPFMLLSLLLAVSPVFAAKQNLREVYLQCKNDKKILKDCTVINTKKGRYYRCKDEEQLIQYTPDFPYEVVEKEEVCFRNTTSDALRNCIAIKDTTAASVRYVCESNAKYREFFPTAEWQELKAEDNLCKEQLPHFNVPRNLDIVQLLDRSE